jgi:hypothetical protein
MVSGERKRQGSKREKEACRHPALALLVPPSPGSVRKMDKSGKQRIALRAS